MKNVKLLWWLSGYFLIAALFLGFGSGTLRAQDNFVKITSLEELDGVECVMVYESSATAGIYANSYASSKYGGESVIIANGTISLEDAYTFTFSKNTEGKWTMYDNKAKKDMTYNGSGTNFKQAAGTWTITKESSGFKIVPDNGNTRCILWSTDNSKFAPYASSNIDNKYFLVNLYKKQEAVAPCEQVTDVHSNPTATAVTLSWTAPETAPENGYKVTITPTAGGDAVVTDAAVAAGTTTYTNNSLTAGTEYTYSIVSVCSETSSSTAVTGNFSTPAAGVKTLNVAMSGNKEGDKYTTAPITFTVTTSNFVLGADGKVSYTIMGGENYEKEGEIEEAETPLVLNDLSVGEYDAEFELVDLAGTSLDPKVSVEKHFVVKLPTVKAPVFSLAEQTSAFTTAQTITLTSATTGATISYSINNGDYAAYTEAGIVLNATGTYVVKAFASKTGMDNSDTVTKTYTLKLPEQVANLKAIYSKAAGDEVLVLGKMVVTHKDSSANSRVWVQDIDKENGASMLLYGVSAAEYKDLKVGDVLENVSGKVALYNGLYELTSLAKLVAVEQGHAVYVDTLTVAYINSNIATVQNALVCVEEVTFTQGTFTASGTGRTHTLNQGDKELQFYVSYTKADYVGENTPEGLLNVTGILGNNSGTAQITARNKADMQEVLICEDVETVSCNVEGSTAHFSWEVEHEPALGYIIEVRTDDAANTLVKKDTVKDPKMLAYDLENVAEGDYSFSVTALCGEGNAAEPVGDHFSVVAAGSPSITLIKPAAGEFTRDSVMFTCKVTNFVLGTGEDAEGSIKYTISGTNLSAPITNTITDTFFYQKFERSGKDTVRLELVDKDGASLNPARVVRRAFTINLPDVATPVFTPEATSATEAIEVTINCATEDANIYYSLNGADYVAYTGAVKLDTTGTYAFKAFATKAKMDTSKVASKTYKLRIPKPLEPGVMFYEPFDGFDAAANGKLDTVLDKYTELPGWTGAAVYRQVAGIVKMGGISDSGYLQTPAIALTEGDAYLLSFDAQAWNGDAETIIVTINGTRYEISGLENTENTGTSGAPTQMKTFEKAFTATAATTIRFSSKNKSKSRFFLDNVKVQVDSDEPSFNVVSTLSMNTVMDKPVSKIVSVTGRHLADDITVTCPTGNFSVEPATLVKEAVMGENGAEFTVTFNAAKAADTVEITLTSGELTKTLKVTATAETATEVENIAALREKDADESTVYTVKGEVVVTAVDGISTFIFRYIFIQLL